MIAYFIFLGLCRNGEWVQPVVTDLPACADAAAFVPREVRTAAAVGRILRDAPAKWAGDRLVFGAEVGRLPSGRRVLLRSIRATSARAWGDTQMMWGEIVYRKEPTP